MKLFAFGVLFGFSGLLLGLTGLGTALAVFAPDRMPAPAITRLVQLDEKLRFLRERPELDPTIVSVGSSIAWRQLDGRALDPVAGGDKRFFNGGTGYLQIHQTRDLTRFYLNQFGNARLLLMMINLPDFRDCTNEPADMLVHDDARRYAFGGWPAAYFYFRYVSPQRYLRTAMSRANELEPYVGESFVDAYGSSPMQVPPDRLPGLRYGDISNDPACVAELKGFIDEITGRGIRVLLVAPPVHPEYRAKFPREMGWLRRILAEVERSVEQPQRFTLRDLTRASDFGAEDFFDAFHLQWPAVQVLSHQIARMIETPAPNGRDANAPGMPLSLDAGHGPLRPALVTP